jgi:NitT/TauT family transport system substrate-binding protein
LEEFSVTRPFFRISLAAAAVCLLAAGCGSAHGSAAAGSQKPEKPDLTVAMVPADDTAGWYIAEQEGLFAKQGLHIKIIPAVSSETAIQGQLNGTYDVTDGNYVSYIQAEVQQHAQLDIFAAGSIMEPGCQEVMVPPHSPIKDVADLKGKTIGVNVLNNIGTLLVSALLRDYGMSVDDVHFKAIPFPDMTAALRDHEVDAAWLPEPFVTGAEEQIGAEPIADLDSGATQSLPISGYVVTKAWAHRYPRTLAALERALVQAQRIADTDPSAVEKAMATYSGVSQTAAAVMAEPDFPLDTDTVLIQRIADLMQQFNLLHQHFDVDQMIG